MERGIQLENIYESAESIAGMFEDGTYDNELAQRNVIDARLKHIKESIKVLNSG